MSLEKEIERGDYSKSIDFETVEALPPVDSRHHSVTMDEITSSHPSQSFPQSYQRPYPQQTRASSYQPNLTQATPLSTYRFHVGIHTDPSLTLEPVPQPRDVDPESQNGKQKGGILSSIVTYFKSGSMTGQDMPTLSRPAPNIGLYRRITASEARYHREYSTFSIVINGALGLQIVFASALTALGAAKGPSTAVTAFGALNTILAGLLTFLKGSGLPNRLKYYENEWRKVREYIEQRERDLALDEAAGRQFTYADVMAEIGTIESMYETVRKDIEANTPDSYVSLSGNRGVGTVPGPSLSKGFAGKLGDIKGQLGGFVHQAEEMMGHGHDQAARTGGDMQERARSGFSAMQQRTHSGLSGLKSRFDSLEKEAATGVHEVVDDARFRAEQSVRDSQRTAYEGAANIQHHADSKARDMEEKIILAAEKAAEKVLQLTKNHHHERDS